MGDLGLLGITIPEQYGGSGMGYLAHAIAMEEISRASASVGLSYGAPQSVSEPDSPERFRGEPLSTCAVRRRTHRGAGHVRAGAGSDVVGIRCARYPGDDFVLNGNKMWITNGPDADVYVIYAKTDPDAGSRASPPLSSSGIPKDFPAHQTGQAWHARLNTCELVFEDCVISDQVLGRSDGVRVLMSGLDYERAVLSGGPVGILQACLDTVSPTFTSESNLVNRLASFSWCRASWPTCTPVAPPVVPTFMGSARPWIEASRAAKMPPP